MTSTSSGTFSSTLLSSRTFIVPSFNYPKPSSRHWSAHDASKHCRGQARGVDACYRAGEAPGVNQAYEIVARDAVAVETNGEFIGPAAHDARRQARIAQCDRQACSRRPARRAGQQRAAQRDVEDAPLEGVVADVQDRHIAGR